MRKSRLTEHFIANVTLRRDDIPSFDDYPFTLEVIKHLHTLKMHPAVTFLVGENGSGKSTLLEAIAAAWGFNAEGGSQNFRFATEASHSDLHQYLTLVKGVRRPKTGFFLRAESFYNVATEIDRLGVGKSYGGLSLHQQSHGESFLSLLMHRFSDNGLYLLDEPEAALSPTRQMSMLVRMHELIEGGSQFIIATHSPILMAYPNAMIYTFDGEGIRPIKFEQTEHYTVTRTFLNNHKAMVEELLSPER
jgi:predicted ATPase